MKAGGGGGGGSHGGGDGTMTSKFRPDWQCPMCAHVNFARRNVCENCTCPRTPNAMPAYAPTHQAVQAGEVAPTEGTPLMKSMGMSSHPLAGAPIGGGGGGGGWHFAAQNPMMAMPSQGQFPPDWKCLKCGNINFARRQECKMCSEPRTADCPPANAMGCKYQPDWKCTSCGNVNFAKRQECKQCAAPRTEDAEPAYAPSHAIHKGGPMRGGMGLMGMGMGGSMGMMGMGFGGMGGMGGGYHHNPMMGANHPNNKPGDWPCYGCGYHNFARRQECGKCGMEKGQGAESAFAAGMAAGGGFGMGRYSPY